MLLTVTSMSFLHFILLRSSTNNVLLPYPHHSAQTLNRCTIPFTAIYSQPGQLFLRITEDEFRLSDRHLKALTIRKTTFLLGIYHHPTYSKIPSTTTITLQIRHQVAVDNIGPTFRGLYSKFQYVISVQCFRITYDQCTHVLFITLKYI